MENKENEGKLELIAVRSFKPYDDMYKVIDFLNKMLKDRHIMFGLSKNDQGMMNISIYEF